MLELQITLRVLNLLRAALDHEIATIVTIISEGGQDEPDGETGGEDTQEGGQDEPGGETGGGGDSPAPGEGSGEGGEGGGETGDGETGGEDEPGPGAGAGGGDDPSGGSDPDGDDPGGVTDPGPGDDTQAGGGTIPTPPVVGQTVAINEVDLMTKANALRGTGKDHVLGVKDGHFGPIGFSGLDLGGGAKLTIVAENRRSAIFERVNLSGATRNIRFQGIGVCPRGVPVLNPNVKEYGFKTEPTTSRIEVVDSVFRGSLDSANHPWWDKATWDAYGLGAVFLQGPDSMIERCYAEGVRFGFNVTGDGGVIAGAYVYGASGDGFRLAADNLTVSDILATDLIYKRDGNHPDFAQAFKRLGDGSIRGTHGLALRRAAAIEWTVRHDNPLRVAVDANRVEMRTPGIMQGIGFHAGGHEDHLIEDLYIRTAVANGVHYGGVKNMVGRRWIILNGDHDVAGQPGANYDVRVPKVDFDGFSGTFDVADVVTQSMPYNSTAPIQNLRNATAADYAAPPPAWVARIKEIAN